MAIKDTQPNTGAGNQSQQSGGQTNQGQQTFQQDPPQQTKQQSWSFHGGNMFNSPISRNLGAESMTKLVKALSELYKDTTPDVEATCVAIDKTGTPLHFSAIAVCLRMKGQKTLRMAYHILILEATGEKLTPIVEHINNMPTEVLRLPSDALDSKMVEVVRGRVAAAFPHHQLFLVDGCVVPRSFNPEDPFQVQNLALNAGLACGTELTIRQEGFKDINLASAQHDSNLMVNIGFNRQDLADAVGNPMRSDVLVNFSAKRPNQNADRSVNSNDQQANISELSVFIDVVWAPVNVGMNQNPYVVAPIPTQKFAARAIITALNSNFSYTPASIGLALATTASLAQENNWIQTFRPQPYKHGEIDLCDFAALNYEGKLDLLADPVKYNNPNVFGTPPETKSETFSLTDLGSFAARLIQPGLVISMDVPECSAQTWYLSPYSAAANGHAAAYDLLYNSYEELTNGNFGKYFPRGEQMFEDQGQRIHLGNWKGRDGMPRDLRHIDYLAVANTLGASDPQQMRDWSDTFTRIQYPLNQRLAARKRIIDGVTNFTAEYTGWAQRVTFRARLLDCLGRACAEAGLSVKVNTPLSASDFSNQRGVAGFVGAALLQPGQSFMSRDMGMQGNYQNPQYMFSRF